MRLGRVSTALLVVWAAQASAQDVPGLPPIDVAPLPPVELILPVAPPVQSSATVVASDLQPPAEILVTQSSVAIGLDPLPQPDDAARDFASLSAPPPMVQFGLPDVETPPQTAMIPPAQQRLEQAAPSTPAPGEWRERMAAASKQVVAVAPYLPQSVLDGITSFYDARDGRALFTQGDGPSAQGKAVLSVATKAGEHGLSRARFEPLENLAAAGEGTQREIALAALAVAYARDARGARVNPLSISRLITATPTLPDAGAVLEGVATATDTAAALEGWNPQHPGYRALKAQLARISDQDHTASVSPKAGSSLQGDIIANMERWRWLPTDLGARHVMVNVPSYRLEMQRDGKTVFETRVIVGKPTSPTPIFSHSMEFLVVNPYWNVPPSIALKEYLPLLKSDPYALQARGLQIVSRGRVVDPATVDWNKMPRSVAIRQPPGERNALGHIKFMFPNDHAVYLHDTPSRGLFSAGRRAFSHGCVRVQNPFALASAVSGWSEGWLRGMVGGAERRLDLKDEVQVHLAYFTLEANADGSLTSREDIYGHHRRMKRLMGL